jgi:hypothetical protein
MGSLRNDCLLLYLHPASLRLKRIGGKASSAARFAFIQALPFHICSLNIHTAQRIQRIELE